MHTTDAYVYGFMQKLAEYHIDFDSFLHAAEVSGHPELIKVASVVGEALTLGSKALSRAPKSQVARSTRAVAPPPAKSGLTMPGGMKMPEMPELNKLKDPSYRAPPRAGTTGVGMHASPPAGSGGTTGVGMHASPQTSRSPGVDAVSDLMRQKNTASTNPTVAMPRPAAAAPANPTVAMPRPAAAAPANPTVVTGRPSAMVEDMKASNQVQADARLSAHARAAGPAPTVISGRPMPASSPASPPASPASPPAGPPENGTSWENLKWNLANDRTTQLTAGGIGLVGAAALRPSGDRG